MVVAMFAIALAINEIFVNQIHSQTFDLDNKVKVKKNETWVIRLEVLNSML